MLKVSKFDSNHAYVKQELPDILVFNLENEKDITIHSSYLNNDDHILKKVNMSDKLIGIIEKDQKEYYIHIKNNILYITPYLNNRTKGSLNILIKQFHNRFIVEPTQYSYLIIDSYTNEKIELNSLLFSKGRKAFLVNAINDSKDPFIHLKISYLNYVTFLEYTNSKKDFAFKTNIISILTSSQLIFDLNSANELLIQVGDVNQVVRLNDLKQLKDIKLNELFNSHIKNPIYLRLNNILYIINKRNGKLSIKTDREQHLLYKYSDILIKKKRNYIKLSGMIHYNTEIKPNSLVTKNGVFLSKLNWNTEGSFTAKLKVSQLRQLSNIHNTIFVAIDNKKLHPLHQSSNLKNNRKVLLSFNSKKHAIIIRRNAANNLSIGNLTSLKIYHPWHKFKIKIARKVAGIYKFINRNDKINVFFEKEASKAVESGKYVFESAASNQSIKSKNVFILDKKSQQYPSMKKKWNNKIIERFSFKNYLYVFLADYFISSELSNHVINTRIFNDKLNDKIKATPLYFLQHGIIFMKPHDNPQNSGFHKKNMTNNIVKSVVSSDVEAKEFNIMGYNDFDIMKTGLPKLDGAKLSKDADKITYMPTWRPWEESEVLNGNIQRTTYYQSLMDIINVFDQAGMLDKLQIAAHNKFAEFAKSHFGNYKNIFVEDPTDTLTNSAIYITDISSIILDAAYRGSYPIFYWKDFDTIIEKHGGTTPVNEDNAPGAVVYSENELIKTVKEVIKNNYKISNQIKENYKKINEFDDNRNTERVIVELIKDGVL
ncbi:CDP-glycerol glycerophosphotransferase family protein [Staphylococcus saprophyticus]|uniref:CDP-glycerol glycerophosphotransferase family protein n=1 Tax=Staphylococcus saprophyticus TaxID=29385 RepID=UPI000852B66A|nr:CDP-glycerol glycerophosphotransferase family protein [Staphylococcus saprophyticus]MDW4347257.1 CDP-glycerol glycerophosphotransferase family protein [Staphylococcus saprophyticus]MDW4453138.1 CDP-glycerol glycerophosphotransferase family protein [Staphylococcus saprophyticus]MDW4524281.1 CDP-glycerol glycerophosphotransferase family protein [Staphylococcus saprophyticus]OEK43951.1 CDP-glycerol glycerophosphotransferase [Staphylococcus saprophyticus]